MAAFTAVSTRRTLNPSGAASATTTQSPTPQSQAPKQQWSPDIRAYVSRSFAVENTLPGISRENVEAKLKLVINESANAGRLASTDWSAFPLPQQLIQQERVDAMSSSNLIPTPTMTTTSTNKRKSSEMSTPTTPPWQRNKPVARSPSSLAFEDRLSFNDNGGNDNNSEPPSKKQDKRQKRFQDASAALRDSSKSNGDLERRRQRFNLGGASPGVSSSSRGESPGPETGPVVGTCQQLEKRYFRLTSAPKPEAVRPLAVLKKTLDMLRKKWRAERNYNYICDQFKSLRQDLTVQHIANEFTVKAYETHAHIALEKGDIGEFNQCQTQLRALYKRKIAGGHPGEFLAYRILYFIYTRNQADMNNVLADLTAADRRDPAVQHALRTRSALALGNYHRFFQLYLDVPHMGIYLMDMFVERERLAALSSISRTYKPDVALSFVSKTLAFEDDATCEKFLVEHGAAGLVERKEGGGSEATRFAAGKAGQLFEAARGQAFRGVDIKGQI